MGLFKNDATRIGFIILAAVFLFGSFCIYDVNRMFNLTSKVIGYFQHTTDVVKVADFEYDVEQLLFTNSGADENEYFAEVKTSSVEGFDKTKKYTIQINGKNCGYVNKSLEYVNANFINTFYSTNNTVLLTDKLNIKINFYKDGTKIVLITKNGEKAVKLWSSYIQKYGFRIKIVEEPFNSTIEADNIPTYTVNLYVDGEIYQALSLNKFNQKEYSLPVAIDNKVILNWKDSEGNLYAKIPLSNIDLYATSVIVDSTSLGIVINNEVNKPDLYADDKGAMGTKDSLNITPYNSQVWDMMKGGSFEVINKLNFYYCINFYGYMIGQVDGGFLGSVWCPTINIKNKSNNEAIKFSFLGGIKDETNTAYTIVSFNFYTFSDEDFPKQANLILEDDEFIQLKTDVKNSFKNNDFGVDFRMVVKLA